MKEVAIVGGGILGLAIGYELSKSSSKYKISIFEKESALGRHQSGNNSGVLHCGLYYKPGSLKAQLALEGIKQMISFCQVNNIDHEVCGKIVVASDEREIKLLDDLAMRGNLNGLSGLKFLTNQELKIREPNVKAIKALLVPEEGIVSYKQVMEAMANYIKSDNGEIFINNKVLGLSKFSENSTLLKTEKFEKTYDLIINCTGLFSDRTFTSLTKQKSPIKILPFRGEYMHIADEYKQIVNHLIYPVPDPQYPFLGVHFTRMVNGGREVGPNAVLALKREGYRNTDFSLIDAIDALTYNGFLRFLSNNFKFAIGEFASSLSTKAFVNKAKKLIPEVEDYMFTKGGTAGVRAQAISPQGEILMDFNIIKENNQIHVLNAPSPGATASLSIAKYIIQNYI
ncbi:L-2-hydroxyglutarate oxidase [Sediminibacterium salmoneum]|uniref:L-2-hydroxyglutarate oxidase n=1 Tax=Sediminibacterium salmoneum TaxID=426421 RepID=UPI00047E6A66|nr:L-2-hydroxyglutarate oxidase [Sediminibacterium salmoneum]